MDWRGHLVYQWDNIRSHGNLFPTKPNHFAIMKSRKRSVGGPQKPNAKSNDDHGGGLASSLGTPDESMLCGTDV